MEFAHRSHTTHSREGFLRHDTETVEAPDVGTLGAILVGPSEETLEKLLKAREKAAQEVLAASGLPTHVGCVEVAAGIWRNAEVLTEDAEGAPEWFAARIVTRCWRVRKAVTAKNAAQAALAMSELEGVCRLAWEAEVLGPEVTRDRAKLAGARKGAVSRKRPTLWCRVAELDRAIREEHGWTRKSDRSRAIVRRMREEDWANLPSAETIAKRLPRVPSD